MNDLERKLQQQTFREPPADLRDAIFGAAEKIIAPPCGTWRDWLWPSPQAWASLAALWLVFAALAWFDRPPASPPIAVTRPAVPGESPFLVFHHHAHALDLPN